MRDRSRMLVIGEIERSRHCDGTDMPTQWHHRFELLASARSNSDIMTTTRRGQAALAQQKRTMKLSRAALLLLLPLFIVACEDSPPTDYIPEPVFTGYIYVDEPITQVSLTRSLATTDSFDVTKSEIDDAVIRIWSDRDTFVLRYERADGAARGLYRAIDTTKLVEPETTYLMRADLADGTVVTAETRTPGRVEWLRKPPPQLQYPIDTIELSPSSDTLTLTRSGEKISAPPACRHNAWTCRTVCGRPRSTVTVASGPSQASQRPSW